MILWGAGDGLDHVGNKGKGNSRSLRDDNKKSNGNGKSKDKSNGNGVRVVECIDPTLRKSTRRMGHP